MSWLRPLLARFVRDLRAIVPIAWIRWSRPLHVGHHAVRRSFAAIGIAWLWSGAVLLLGLGILAAFGIE